ncbi:MAG: DUF448 domain-containing protein [Armatimonadetes bacterium]|nr:DUF448 domain-containing protein [Armatimonadota bacterium]
MEDRHPQRATGYRGEAGQGGGGGPVLVGGPIRTCVVCRAKRLQSELVRVRVATDGRPTTGAGFGRSAYCCDNYACREGLTARGRLSRAWRRPVDEGLVQAVRQEVLCQQR